MELTPEQRARYEQLKQEYEEKAGSVLRADEAARRSHETVATVSCDRRAASSARNTLPAFSSYSCFSCSYRARCSGVSST